MGGVGTATGASSKHSHERPCIRYRCRTLAVSRQVRIYQATPRHTDREEYFQSTFARWLPSGRVTALGDYFDFEGSVLERFALSGRFTAYALSIGSAREDGGSWRVLRLNVQTGRREEVPANGEKGGGLGEPGVTDVVVTPAGSVAWIIDGTFQDPTGKTPAPGVVPPGSKAVYELAAGAKTPILLAYDPTIDPKSLAAVPGHLYWTDGGQPRGVEIE